MKYARVSHCHFESNAKFLPCPDWLWAHPSRESSACSLVCHFPTELEQLRFFFSLLRLKRDSTHKLLLERAQHHMKVPRYSMLYSIWRITCAQKQPLMCMYIFNWACIPPSPSSGWVPTFLVCPDNLHSFH